jgi:hypothetical protein
MKKDTKDEKQEDIFTEIDLFYIEISKKQKLTLKEVEKILMLKKETILLYAEILSKNNLIITKYPLFGEPYFILNKNNLLKEEELSLIDNISIDNFKNENSFKEKNNEQINQDNSHKKIIKEEKIKNKNPEEIKHNNIKKEEKKEHQENHHKHKIHDDHHMIKEKSNLNDLDDIFKEH